MPILIISYFLCILCHFVYWRFFPCVYFVCLSVYFLVHFLKILYDNICPVFVSGATIKFQCIDLHMLTDMQMTNKRLIRKTWSSHVWSFAKPIPWTSIKSINEGFPHPSILILWTSMPLGSAEQMYYLKGIYYIITKQLLPFSKADVKVQQPKGMETELSPATMSQGINREAASCQEGSVTHQHEK